MIGLTPKQLDLLRFIAGFWAANYRAPSYREMSDAFGHPVGGWAFDKILSLRERGHLDARLHPIAPPSIPRAPDGAPLYFVKVAG